MHIVQVANFVTPTSGGQRLALNSLAEQYLAHGHETTLVIPGAKKETRIENSRKVVSLPGVPVPFSGGYRAIVRKDEMQKLLPICDLTSSSYQTRQHFRGCRSGVETWVYRASFSRTSARAKLYQSDFRNGCRWVRCFVAGAKTSSNMLTQ